MSGRVTEGGDGLFFAGERTRLRMKEKRQHNQRGSKQTFSPSIRSDVQDIINKYHLLYVWLPIHVKVVSMGVYRKVYRHR